MKLEQAGQIVVLISANTEWRSVKNHWEINDSVIQQSPSGEWFSREVLVQDHVFPVVFFHGGWGKISAAASTQYVIDRWKPRLVVNLGTCGGFQGLVEQGEIILVERTLVYDIFEQMGDSQAAIDHYAVELDHSWMIEPYPDRVRRTLMVSADRDLIPEEVLALHDRYGAIAGDWESGAIAYVAKKNKVKLLILRGVSDIVNSQQGEAYIGDGKALFQQRASDIMRRLLASLPGWLAYGF